MNPFTADSIPDQTGRTAVVTGANSGIGQQAATALARKGARVVLACRDERRGRDAEQRVRSLSGSSAVELRLLDLSSLASVRRFAEQWTEPLDVLVNNAGVMATPRTLTEDGFEQQFGINHLGHFALTGLLLEHLRAAEAPRVVSVSSLAHKRGRINFSDLQSEKRYRRWSAYQQSKAANLYFMVELDRRARAAGWPLASVAAHPGLANTNLTAGMQLPAVLDVFPLDVLVNNAGVMATPRTLTEDGFEQQFGINHLGHFALTGLLLEHLRAAEAPRVVSVSSLAHKRGRINFSDLQSEKRYRRWSAYQQSKAANLYFMVELDRRARAAGWPLASVAAHPGLANT
ncbi:oxidoreductase, partial [Arthrobacter sp. Br18]|uniref:oxidoreductase n=1 Tax=Arthrobacter sp. Br18 TaxID=1312954 RepID=UPI000687189F